MPKQKNCLLPQICYVILNNKNKRREAGGVWVGRLGGKGRFDNVKQNTNNIDVGFPNFPFTQKVSEVGSRHSQCLIPFVWCQRGRYK